VKKECRVKCTLNYQKLVHFKIPLKVSQNILPIAALIFWMKFLSIAWFGILCRVNSGKLIVGLEGRMLSVLTHNFTVWKPAAVGL